MNQEVTIPTLAKFECPRCQRQTVAEAGSTLLCQNCVNEFLANNVGLMQEIPSAEQPEVVPLEPRAVDKIEVPPGGFVPGGGE